MSDSNQRETFINIIGGLRAGMSRKDVCDYARNALATLDVEALRQLDAQFEADPQPEWYRRVET